MILLSLESDPALLPWEAIAFPGKRDDVIYTIMSAVPGIHWDRTLRGFRGARDALEAAAEVLQLAEVCKVRNSLPVLPIFSSPIATPGLRPYQTDGASWVAGSLLFQGAALLGDEMGIGKTPQAIAAASAIGAQKILVVAPAIVNPHWQASIARWGSSLPEWRVTSYEKFQTAFRGGSKTVPALGEGWDHLILDESHNCANPSAKRSKALTDWRSENSISCTLLTGTPLTSEVRDLWAQLNLMHPGRWGGSAAAKVPRWLFEKRYCNGHYEEVKAGAETLRVWNSKGRSHEAELKRRLKTVLLRRTKAEVATDLPPRTRTLHEIELPAKARKDLARAQQALGYDSPRESIPRLLSNCEEYKIAAAIELAEELRRGGAKVLILTLRKDTCKRIAEALGAPAVDGETAPHLREAILKAATDCAVATLPSVTTGINLVNFDTMIMVGLDWLPSTILQGESRIHRIGQVNAVSIHFLIGKGTVDEFVRDRVLKRLDTFQEAIGDSSDGLAGSLGAESEEDLLRSLIEAMK